MRSALRAAILAASVLTAQSSFALDMPYATVDTLTGVATTSTGRVTRDFNPSTILSPKASCPGVSAPASAFAYRTYTFTNTATTAIGVAIDLEGLTFNNTFAIVYLNSFDPSAPCTNYLADTGNSSPMVGLASASFTVPAGATFVVVVTEQTPGAAGSYRLKVLHGVGIASQYTNFSTITINDQGIATPYPHTITTPALGGGVSHVSVNLYGFTHTFPHDVQMLLTSPGGVNSIVMANVGGGHPGINGINFQIDDAADSSMPNNAFPMNATFKPTLLGTVSSLPAPAPPFFGTSYKSAFSTFEGLNASGAWNLYVYDQASGDSGAITDGWALSLHLETAPTVNPVLNLALTAGDQNRLVNLGVVSDAEWAAEELKVTTFADHTVMNPFLTLNSGGHVSSWVSVDCGAAGKNPTLNLMAQDQNFGISHGVNVTISANPAPTLGNYPSPGTILAGATTQVTPSAAPGDNGTFTLTASTDPAFSGTVDVDHANGIVTIGNAGPVGDHTITLNSVDNCGAVTARNFTFHVNAVPPTITSPALAGGTTGAPFTYNLTASGTAPVTYAVTSGTLPAGLSLNGSQITGTPTAIGLQKVTITATNAGGTGKLDLSIDVGTIGDTDGDGFPDALETAFGSDPSDYNSTPMGGSPGGVPQSLQITKESIGLKFSTSGADGILISGILPIPAGFVVNGQIVGVQIGGFAAQFVLNAKGLSPKAKDMMSLKVKAAKGVVAAQSAKYSIKLSHENLAALLASSGLVNASESKVPVTVKTVMFFNGQIYVADKTLSYTAKAGKTGAAK